MVQTNSSAIDKNSIFPWIRPMRKQKRKIAVGWINFSKETSYAIGGNVS